MRTFWDFVRAENQMSIRNRQALFWRYFFPILLMGLLGIVFGHGYGGDFKLAIVPQDHGMVANALTQAFKSAPGVKVRVPATQQDAMRQLRDGDIQGVLVVPAGTQQRFQQDAGTTALPFYFDNSNLSSAGQVTSLTGQVVTAVGDRLSGISPKLGLAPAGIKTHSFNYLDFLVPGVVALALMQNGVFAVGGRMVFDKQKGVLRRLRATPMPLSSYVTSNVLVQLVSALVQTALILAVGMVIFKVKISGSLLNTGVLAVIGAGCFVSLGFAIAAFSSNIEVAQALMQIVQMPMMFLSGIFFPMNNAPSWIQPVVKAMPMKYLADGMRSVVVDAHSLWWIRWDILILLAFSLVFLTISVRFFRWE
jgi:ABC-2 type transport system permease protein